MSAGAASGPRASRLRVGPALTSYGTMGSPTLWGIPTAAGDGQAVPPWASTVRGVGSRSEDPTIRTGVLQVTYDASGVWRIGEDLGGVEGTNFVEADATVDGLANANAVRAKLAADWLASAPLSSLGTLLNTGGQLVLSWSQDVDFQTSVSGGSAAWSGTVDPQEVQGGLFGYDGNQWWAAADLIVDSSAMPAFGQVILTAGWDRVALVIFGQSTNDVLANGISYTVQGALRFIGA